MADSASNHKNSLPGREQIPARQAFFVQPEP